MDVIHDFDPWGDPLCTCPSKYSFDPYTGCAHRCLYCYITSYIPRAFECRPKEDLLKRLERDLRKIDKRRIISMSNSSDPYPPIEAELKLTRACIELFAREGCRLLVITKSDLVARDADLLAEMGAVVSVTITTLSDKTCKRLEPGAPSPKRRLAALRRLADREVPTAVRLDPLIPGINDIDIEKIIEAAVDAGASHVTSSTYKLRPDSWRRIREEFPEAASQLAYLYFGRGERRRNSWYLPLELRRDLMERVREACDRHGLTFASCREGLVELTSGASCDGSHLVRTILPPLS
ncbi:MAG: radical SAM protein [Hadesarchaea archaeon]|nr:radical SAM protein [Hadesarchaea archaeon]